MTPEAALVVIYTACSGLLNDSCFQFGISLPGMVFNFVSVFKQIINSDSLTKTIVDLLG